MKKISLIKKIQSEVEKLSSANTSVKKGKDLVFFRGQPAQCDLLPGIWRNNIEEDKVSRVENQLFCDTSIICADNLNSQTSWEVLAMMQHFGIPTRLLDWTSSLGNALFFALEKCLGCNKECKRPDRCKDRPSIWIIAPHKMHECFYKDDKDLTSKVSITIGVDKFPDYKECFIINACECPEGENIASRSDCCGKWNYPDPIFLEIPWRNLRIKSQKGYFTFHKGTTPLNRYTGYDKFLSQVTLSVNDIREAKELINLLDISGFDMYSDLSSLSKYLKKKYCNNC